MADNIDITAGSGTKVATDDDGTAHHQYVKLEFGADNTQTKVTSSDPLPVTISGAATGTIGVNLGKVDGTIQINVGKIDDNVSVKFASVSGTAGVNLGKVDGTVQVNVGKIDDHVAIKFTSVGNTAGVNIGKVDGTIQTTVGRIDDVVSVRMNTIAGTVGVNIGKVDGTIQTNVGKIDDIVAIKAVATSGTFAVHLQSTGGTQIVKIASGDTVFVNAAHTAGIFTVSGSTSGVSASGVTLVAPSESYNFKIFAYQVQTTAITSTAIRFVNGAGAGQTEFWRPLVTAVETTSSPKGANLAVSPPGFIFATGTNTTLAIEGNAGALVHYSVSYIKESS